MCILYYYYAQTTDVQSTGTTLHRNVLYYTGYLLYYLLRKSLDNAYIIIHITPRSRQRSKQKSIDISRGGGEQYIFNSKVSHVVFNSPLTETHVLRGYLIAAVYSSSIFIHPKCCDLYVINLTTW